MASKKPTTTTQPVKTKPRTIKKQELIENKDLPVIEPVKALGTSPRERAVKKTTKKAKEEPVAQPSTLPVEKPKRKSNIEKGSQAAAEWSLKMKAAREAKKAERLAQQTQVAAV